MAEDDRLVDIDVAVDREHAAETDGRSADSGADTGRRLRDRLPGVGGGPRFGVFSVRAFLLALVLAVAGIVLGSLVPVVGIVGRYVGLFVAAFVVGLVSDRRRYLEVAFAGALAAGLGFLLSALGTTFLPVVADYGVEIAGVGAATGLLVSVVGHYFGRDLRAGLTRDV